MTTPNFGGQIAVVTLTDSTGAPLTTSNPFPITLPASGSGPGAGTAGTASLLVGGVYNTSAPTLTNGQQAAAQFDAKGSLHVVPCDSLGVPLSTSNPVLIYRSDTLTPISTKTTTLIKSGAGTLTRITIQPGTADTLTIYDALTATGTPWNTFTIVATDRVIEFGAAFAIGLTIVSGGTTAGNYGVIWR